MFYPGLNHCFKGSDCQYVFSVLMFVRMNVCYINRHNLCSLTQKCLKGNLVDFFFCPKQKRKIKEICPFFFIW